MNAVTAEQPAVSAPPARFVDNGDGTVTDTRSGLMWSKATLNEEEVNHAEAEKLCADLDLAGHADWRLPSVEELFALADRSKSDPAIDTEAFPDTKADWYWSSTITAWSSGGAWVVYFGSGYAYYVLRDYDFGFVRAVRAVAPGQSF